LSETKVRAQAPGRGGRDRRAAFFAVAGLVAVWQAASSLGWTNAYLLPSPLRVGAALLRAAASGELERHAAASGTRVLEGFGLAIALGFPAAILVFSAPKLGSPLNPVLTFLRNVPPLALVPLLILWFGIGEASKLALIVLASFFPIFMGTLSGLGNVDPRLVEMGRSLGFSRFRILARVMIPESVPGAANGLRLGLGYSWRALVGAEMVAASSGLGYWILDSEEMARIDLVFAGILAIGALGIILDRAAYEVSRRLLPWARLEAQWYA
jgi:sulfonate transport system permease protein